MTTPLVSECPRHGFPSAPTGDPHRPYWVARCVHRGLRFVVQIESEDSDYCTVDYVEDERPGTPRVIEGHDFMRDRAAVGSTWEALVARLRAGGSPASEAP
jgi:hypothetical protein